MKKRYRVVWRSRLGDRFIGKNGRAVRERHLAVTFDEFGQAADLAQQANGWPVSERERRWWIVEESIVVRVRTRGRTRNMMARGYTIPKVKS